MEQHNTEQELRLDRLIEQHRDPLYRSNTLNQNSQAHTIKSFFVTLLYFGGYLFQDDKVGLKIDAEK